MRPTDNAVGTLGVYDYPASGTCYKDQPLPSIGEAALLRRRPVVGTAFRLDLWQGVDLSDRSLPRRTVPGQNSEPT